MFHTLRQGVAARAREHCVLLTVRLMGQFLMNLAEYRSMYFLKEWKLILGFDMY